MKPKVTIVVPVYKASRYIERCAKSLFNQSFQEIEYLFVNDHTPDDSFVILEKLIHELKVDRTKINIIRNATNLGPAVSRNYALDVAQGEYVLMVDSDDYIDLNMVEEMYHTARTTQADIVVSDMMLEYSSRVDRFHDFVPANRADYFVEMLTNQRTSPSLCNKLIKLSLYKHPECRIKSISKYMEDKAVCARLYYFAHQIAKVDKAFYHYTKTNLDATTHAYSNLHFESIADFWHQMDAFICTHAIEIKNNLLTDLEKVKNKQLLMFAVSAHSLRKQHAFLFRDEELKVWHMLKLSEKMMIFLIRNKLFIFTNMLKNLVGFKSNFQKKWSE